MAHCCFFRCNGKEANFSASSDTFADEEDLFGDRAATSESISPEQALIHMMKCMMGTGMLSLPLAFKYSGLAVTIESVAFHAGFT
uniref:Aa_trans domain-containing protein n=1 Tax=Ascaris lumbricoides TaxID=6252 RepID=A0A0M3HI68_ASCLU